MFDSPHPKAGHLAVLTLAASLILFRAASAQEPPADSPQLNKAKEGPLFYPFKGMWGNFKTSFDLDNTLYYHLPAVASTILLTTTDWDHDIQYATQKYQTTPQELNQAFFDAGWYAPMVISGTVYSTGLILADDTFTRAGAASIQAMILTGGVTLALKGLSGRRGPAKNVYPGADSGDDGGFRRTKSAQDWNFAFWENFGSKERRLFWPSGHTSSMFAIAAALTASTGDTTTGVISYSLAGYMGWSMLDGDDHWASDVVAGALIGHAIGWTVGMSYRGKTKLGHLKESKGLISFRMMPVTGAHLNGVSAQWFF
jgi:membrane-associated phospholipid phosphatase